MEQTLLTPFLPHGQSTHWDTFLFWTNTVAGGLTAIAFFSIPVILLGIAYHRRRDTGFNLVLVAISTFLLAIGVTRAVELWNIWHVNFRSEAGMKMFTAIISGATAIYLLRQRQLLLAMPSPQRLREQNTELESRVAARTRELAEANDALRQREARLELVMRGNDEGIWEWNVLLGEFIFSERILELLRIPPLASPTPLHLVRGFFRLVDPKVFQEAMRSHDEEGKKFGFEAQFIRPDETRVWLRVRGASRRNEAGKITHMAGSVHDVDAERRDAETLSFHARVLSQVTDVVVATDFDRNISYLNPAGEKLYGVSAAEVTGGPLDAVYTVSWRQPGDQAHAVETMEAVGVWSGSVAHVLRNGRRIPVESSVNYLTDPSGRRTGMLGVIRSISKQLELEEQVRVAQKMEAVGLLAGGVAHDFNNLLQVISGFTSLALEPDAPWADRKANLELVRGAADRAAQLTRQLLAFGRRQNLQTADLDLNRAVEDLLKMISRVIGAQVSVDFQPGKSLGNVRVDRAQFDQVILNLCLNARDAMPTGGKLTLATENVLVNASFRETHPWAKPGRYVLVTVSDTGVGMDHQTRARIFEPFFTTKGSDRGTGLGLAVVYGVVKQHDGMVHVYSEQGMGTTFKIYLPIMPKAAKLTAAPQVPTSVRGTETILVAEDEDLVRELAQKILERAGYTVLLTGDGDEAVATFVSNKDKIALLLFDVVMPNLGGREASQKISELRPGLPVVFCSGYTGEAFVAETLRGPRTYLLAKPYSAEELLTRVRLALDAV